MEEERGSFRNALTSYVRAFPGGRRHGAQATLAWMLRDAGVLDQTQTLAAMYLLMHGADGDDDRAGAGAEQGRRAAVASAAVAEDATDVVRAFAWTLLTDDGGGETPPWHAWSPHAFAEQVLLSNPAEWPWPSDPHLWRQKFLSGGGEGGPEDADALLEAACACASPWRRAGAS